MKKDIRTLAALLIASATFVACSSDDSFNENQQPANGKYTMTINASKGEGANTRALSLDGSTLNATWATSENVFVQKNSTWATGSLIPQANGATATLKGELTIDGGIAANDVLTLQFPKSGDISYTGQVGTLDDIAANFDYATATVEVESVSATGNITPKAATTTFTNLQAIVKFTLLDKGNSDAAINATQLVVNDGTNDYTINPVSGTSEIYVAIPGFSEKKVTLTATVGDDTYIYVKSGVTFTNGEYYEITVKMTKVKPAAEATSADYGKVVCNNGHLHPAKTAVTGDCTAVAVFGYISGSDRYAIALQDAANATWNAITSNGGANANCAVPGTWTVAKPDGANWYVATQPIYSGIFQALGSSNSYNATSNAFITTNVGGTALSGSYWTTTEYQGMFGRTFEDGRLWQLGKTNSNKVRPVLKF